MAGSLPVHALVATCVDADGHRQVLGIQVTTSEDGAGWLTFFRDVVARGVFGVRLGSSDAHAGLVAATAATLPGAAWQRCRTHLPATLMSATHKSSWRGSWRSCTACTTSPTRLRSTSSSTGSSTPRWQVTRRRRDTMRPPRADISSLGPVATDLVEQPVFFRRLLAGYRAVTSAGN